MASNEGFAAVPNWMIQDDTFTIFDLSVYAALASLSGPGGIHPSQGWIASKARCSERKVRQALAVLEERGVVERVRRRGGEGRATGLTNGYVLHPNGRLGADEEPWKGAAPRAGSSKGPAPEDEGTGTREQVTPLIDQEPITKSASRGTRIPDPFIVTSGMREWAASEAPLVDVDRETRSFVDYWRAVPGSKGVKLDWVATWRNSMRRAQGFAERSAPKTPAPADPVDAWMYDR